MPPQVEGRHEPRQVRAGGGVLARAAGAGALGGAVLGTLVVVVSALQRWRDDESDPFFELNALTLTFTGAVGALVGIVTALAAALVWLITVDVTPPRPLRSRLLGAVTAVGTVFLIGLCFSVDPRPLLALSLAGGAVAFVTLPTVGYR